MIPLTFGPPPQRAVQASVIRPITQMQRGRVGSGCASREATRSEAKRTLSPGAVALLDGSLRRVLPVDDVEAGLSAGRSSVLFHGPHGAPRRVTHTYSLGAVGDMLGACWGRVRGEGAPNGAH